MTTEQQVQRAKTPQEAMLVLAQALDRIEAKLAAPQADPWMEWRAGEVVEDVVEPVVQLSIDQEAGTTEIRLARPSDDKMEWRRMFEQQQLRLAESLGDGENWAEVYAMGGPLWLYYGNRELVMGYPRETRKLMVADVQEDSPDEAHAMSIDILKHDCEVPDVGAGDGGLDQWKASRR